MKFWIIWNLKSLGSKNSLPFYTLEDHLNWTKCLLLLGCISVRNERLFWEIPYRGRLSVFLLQWLKKSLKALASNVKILSWKFVSNLLSDLIVRREKFENLPPKVPTWAGPTLQHWDSMHCNDWIKVWRLALASKMKILSWKSYVAYYWA